MCASDKYCAFNIAIDVDAKIFNGVTFRPVARKPLPWRQELVETARHIRASTDRPIYLCMSGGIDSEVAARAFVEAKIPFRALTLRHVQNTNEHEVAYAMDWCRRNDVELMIVPFDVTNFFADRVWRYIDAGHNAGSRTYLSYMYMHIVDMVESMGGSAVMCSGETLFKSDSSSVSLEFRLWWYNNIRHIENVCSGLHFPWFFKTTPEMVAAYLNEELVRLFTTDPSYYACAPLPEVQTLEKTLVYHRHFPDMRRRPKNTGWEDIRKNISNIGMWIDAFHARPFHILDSMIYIPVTHARAQLGLDD